MVMVMCKKCGSHVYSDFIIKKDEPIEYEDLSDEDFNKQIHEYLTKPIDPSLFKCSFCGHQNC